MYPYATPCRVLSQTFTRHVTCARQRSTPRFPKSLRPLSRHRRGRKTKTSSDASDEAPERAQKDTSKEVKLHWIAVSSSCAFRVKFLRLSSDASHVRVPGYCSSPFPRGNSILPRRFESLRLALAATLYQIIRPADGNFAARYLRRRPIRALSAGRSL